MEDSRLISTEQGKQLQKEFDLDIFMETSAKSGFNTTELFIEAAKLLYREHSAYNKKSKKGGENLNKVNEEQKKRGCC